MRILLAHAGDIEPDVLAALDEHVPAPLAAELVDVSGEGFAYWRAVRERWDGTGDLVIVEHDNVIHESVIPQFAACAGDWCVFPYLIFNSAQRLTQGLGCTKFSAALQRRVPAEEFEADGRLHTVLASRSAGWIEETAGIPWQFLDIVIAERLKLGHGLVPHVHEPDVVHLHDYSGMVTVGSESGCGRRDDTNPYHRELPRIFGPAEALMRPVVMVYGAELTDVDSLDDAARLANKLRERYMHDDGSARDLPAQVDTSRPRPMRFRTDKVSHGYLPAYLRIAGELGTAARVCEVGVWHGESLQMWQALFPGGLVCGVDSDPGARWPAETVPVVCAQDDPDLPSRLQGISPGGWDLIVDDASHDGALTRRTWELLWPLVVPGGRYVVEDWQVGLPGTPWNAQYGDSMLRTAESFLRLLDKPGSGRLLPGQLESAEYRYGMIIMRKA